MSFSEEMIRVFVGLLTVALATIGSLTLLGRKKAKKGLVRIKQQQRRR